MHAHVHKFFTFNIIVPSTTRSSKWSSSFRIFVHSCVLFLSLSFLLQLSFRNSGQRTAGGGGIKAGTLRIHTASRQVLAPFISAFFVLFFVFVVNMV